MTGGAGFARDSRNNYEKNLGYLDKFNASHFKRSHYKVAKQKLYKYKDATPKHLQQIKDKIRADQNRNQKASFILIAILVILSGIGMMLLFV